MEYQSELGKITIEREGREIECDVLFTFDCEELGKTYLGFTDGTISDNGRKNIYVKSYDPILGTKLEDITDNAEVEMVVSVLKKIEQDDSDYHVKGGAINE